MHFFVADSVPGVEGVYRIVVICKKHPLNLKASRIACRGQGK